MNLKLPSLPDKDTLAKFVPDIFRNLLVVYIILLVFSYISPGYVGFYIDLNWLLYILIVLGAASLLFYAHRLEKSDLSDKARFEVLKGRLSYAFLGLLLVLAVQYNAPEPLLEWVRTPLMVAAVALGAVTFYLNRDKVEEIEEEARQEEIEEKRREMEFAGSYPGINRMWGLRWVVKWMFKEGWWYSAGLFLVLFIGASNIFVNLGYLPFHQDENLHFITSYGFKETGSFVKWDFLNNQSLEPYTRNFIYTYIVYIFNSIFGFTEFSSRLPGAIIGFSGIFLVYFISKRITNQKIIALISSYIYSINDTVIYFSRFVRGYIFLIFITLILFYLSYKLINEKDIKKGYACSILTLIIFLLGLHFQATIILIVPLLIISFFLFSIKNYSKTIIFNLSLLLFIIFLIFNIMLLTKMVDIPLGISQHINLNFNLLNYDQIYLIHLMKPYNIPFQFLFIFPLIFLWDFRNKLQKNSLFFCSLYVPLFISLYFFNRYEDFRYIALLQGITIIFISMFILYLYKLVESKNRIKNIAIVSVLLIYFISFQAPSFPEIQPFSKISQSDWKNIEGDRIHRRAAQPDSSKAFGYIFEQKHDVIKIIKLADGGINWNDNYYLSLYLKKYPQKKVVFYQENAYYSGKFKEIYNYAKNYTELEDNIPYQNIIYDDAYIISNLRHLTNTDLIRILDNNCENLAESIGIFRYNYFESYETSENNFFPNVFVCNQTNNKQRI